MRRLLWLTAETPMGPVRVYVVDWDGKYYGSFDPNLNEVEVAVGPIDKMKLTLHHELMHVSCAMHSRAIRAPAFGSRSEAREESIISFLEPPQFDILTRNGWLNYPDPPRYA